MKKYLKKLLCSIFAISILLVSTIHVNAATPYRVISDDKAKTKVGNYYIWLNSEKGIYVSKSKKSSPKKIVSKPKSSDTHIGYTLVTNGSRIYYGTVKCNGEGFSIYMKIYRIDVSGKNNTYIGKVSRAHSFGGYYNGNLFVEKNDYYKGEYEPTIIDTYIYNLKSKKASLVKKDFKIICQNGKYMIGAPIYENHTGSPTAIHIYNASTKKIYKISSEASSHYTKFLNGKIYYVEINNYFEEDMGYVIKTCSYTAKNKKTVYTIKMEDDGEKPGNLIGIKSSYVEYTKFKDNFSKEIYYRYYYSSKKVVKIKEVKL